MTPMAPRQPDRRQRKSRAALQQALVSLIATKPYDAITIEDVTEAADVARATFYAHYKDKRALLNQASHELVTDLTEHVAQLAPRSTGVYTGAGVAAIFRHAGEHRDLYRLVISGEGGAAARAELVVGFEQTARVVFARMTGRPPRVTLSTITTAFVGALLLTLESWLGEEPMRDPVDIAEEFLRAQVGGLEWALGYDAGDMRLVPAVEDESVSR